MRAPQSVLLIEERRREITKILEAEGRVAVDDLVKRLKVSAVTLRSDLGHLAKQGLLVRSYGGAILPQDSEREFPLRIKRTIRHAEKVRIATLAASLIKPHQRLIIDSGTSTAELVRAIKRLELKGLTVITHALHIAEELADTAGISTIMIGGLMRHVAGSFVGPQAERQLRELHADHAFLGVDGLDPALGIFTPDLLEAQINTCMIQVSEEVTVLADATKLGRRSLSIISDLPHITRLITDDSAPMPMLESIRRAGVEVLIA